MPDENLTEPLVTNIHRRENRQRQRNPFLAIFAPLLSTVSFILSNSTSVYCDFAFRRVDVRISTATGLNYSTQIGIWTYERTHDNSDTCYWYPSDFPVDSYLRSSRAFSLLALGFGGAATFVLLFSACFPLTQPIWKLNGIFLFLACVFQGLVFLIFSSNLCTSSLSEDFSASCTLRRGGRLCISAIVFWFISSMAVLQSDYLQRPGQEQQRAAQRVTTTEEVKPDGTRVTNATTSNEFA
mmetsp:Transcript_14234/g.17931  ORF Transcript_14234/g.17931 Transcript_14234/m.17931 type:complete len:240 (+) Transcript_14234:129-848(+)